MDNETADPDGDRALATSAEAFADAAARVYADLPEPFRTLAAEVVMQTAEWPDDEILEHFGITTPYGLLGLYQGVSRDQRSVTDSGLLPDMVFLYRHPIVAYAAAEGETVAAVVRNVLIHEIGHHFGLSDADMEAIESADD